MQYCTCDKQEANGNSTDKFYIRCLNCKKPIKRHPDMCKYFLETGYCNLAEENHYTMRCRINGEFKKCANGVNEE